MKIHLKTAGALENQDYWCYEVINDQLEKSDIDAFDSYKDLKFYFEKKTDRVVLFVKTLSGNRKDKWGRSIFNYLLIESDNITDLILKMVKHYLTHNEEFCSYVDELITEDSSDLGFSISLDHLEAIDMIEYCDSVYNGKRFINYSDKRSLLQLSEHISRIGDVLICDVQTIKDVIFDKNTVFIGEDISVVKKEYHRYKTHKRNQLLGTTASVVISALTLGVLLNNKRRKNNE